MKQDNVCYAEERPVGHRRLVSCWLRWSKQLPMPARGCGLDNWLIFALEQTFVRKKQRLPDEERPVLEFSAQGAIWEANIRCGGIV